MSDDALTSTAIDSVANLARQAAGKTIEIEGATYSTTLLVDPRKRDPEPDALEVSTLTSLVAYVRENRDGLVLDTATLLVEGPTVVSLVGSLGAGYYRQRFRYVRAKCQPAGGAFAFGEFLALEGFHIALQALFVDDYQRADVLKLCGNVKSDRIRVQVDDGKTQTVEARAGVATVENVSVPNPVTLAPFRTFTELDQPSSPFVFRLREGAAGAGVQAALFEADGGTWRLAAVDGIKVYLDAELADLSPAPIVIA